MNNYKEESSTPSLYNTLVVSANLIQLIALGIFVVGVVVGIMFSTDSASAGLTIVDYAFKAIIVFALAKIISALSGIYLNTQALIEYQDIANDCEESN